MLNIVIPMAGRGARFASAGFTVPKPLIPVGGKPMIAWVVENVRPSCPHRFHFICLAQHLEEHAALSGLLRELSPDCTITPIDRVTEGAACTVLLARDRFDTREPLMIANSDQIVDLDIDEYLRFGERAGADGLIMTFWADDPKWSYCRLRDDGTVCEVVEKKVVSNEATVGIYNFSRGADFARAADSMIARDLRVNGEFYVAPTYNEMIAEGARVEVMATGREYDGMYGLGIPEDLQYFRTTDRFLSGARGSDDEVLAELGGALAWALASGRVDALQNLLAPELRGRGDSELNNIVFGSLGVDLGGLLRLARVGSLSCDAIKCNFPFTSIEFEVSGAARGAFLVEWRGGKIIKMNEG